MEPSPGASAPAAAPVLQLDRRARLRILFAILLALFLSALDQTIVGTALPRIVTDLSGTQLYTWVVTIYLLTATITGPIYGKLSDQFGRRPLLITGICLFLAGSFLSGLSGDMFQLIMFRGLQGIGAGSIFPIALAVIGDMFTPQERGKYQGLFGAVFGIAALIGPALGGFLTDTISWHWVFFVNMPVGAIALAIIWRLLPSRHESGVTRQVDYLGVFVFSLALVPILVGLTNMRNLPWSDPWAGGLMLVGGVLGLVFLWVETRAAEPIVPLELFRNRTYAASMIAAFLASFGFFGAIIFLPIWYQVVNGSSATESGYQLLPLLAGLILASTLSGQLVSRTGRYKWLTVGALATLALGLLLMTNLRADTPPPVVWLWQFIAGLGIGPSLIIFTIIVQNAVPWQKLGAATSNLTFFRQIGGTVGLALAGTVFGVTVQRESGPRVAAALESAGVPRAQADAFTSQFAVGGTLADELSSVGDLGARILGQVPEGLRPVVEPFIPAIVRAVHDALSLGIANTMWLSVLATAIAVAAALTLREVPLRSRIQPQPRTTPQLEPQVSD